VFEFAKWFQVGLVVVQHELMGIVIHPGEQCPALIDDGHPLTPGKYGSEKTRDLDVLLFLISMRNNDRIGRNESGLIVAIYLVVQECLEF
jgi:hypothetical protein